MRPELVQADITTMEVDAIVNAANTSLLGGGGVDGAIHRKGGPAILEACLRIREQQGGCAPGQAVITTGAALPAKYVIHTVGPVWTGNQQEESQLLADCYRNSLTLALDYGVKSIAFPNISTGVYHFPKTLAAGIAIRTVLEFPGIERFERVIFVCFDAENMRIYQQVLLLGG